MSTIRFDKSLIRYVRDARTSEEVLCQMCGQLQEMGLVKDSFQQAILDREAAYPTGLDCGGINIAIPHSDIQNVNEAAICVGVLENPVLFHAMDDPEREIPVQLVIMLALTEAHGHIEILQKIVALIQNQEELRQILESENADAVEALIKKHIL